MSAGDTDMLHTQTSVPLILRVSGDGRHVTICKMAIRPKKGAWPKTNRVVRLHRFSPKNIEGRANK